MPIANRCIEPVEVSRIKVPDSAENEFEYVVNATLTNFIRQLACLSVKANDIFGELTDTLTEIILRSENLENKVNDLSERIGKFDTKNTAPNFVPPKVEVFRTNKIDDELIDQTKMPDCIREIFSEAEPPPNLQSFDIFRNEGEESLKFYTNPQFFLEEWMKSTNVDKVKKKKKKRKSKHNLLSDDNNASVRLKPPPAPPNINQGDNFKTGRMNSIDENSFADVNQNKSKPSNADPVPVVHKESISNIPLPPAPCPPPPPGPPPSSAMPFERMVPPPPPPSTLPAHQNVEMNNTSDHSVIPNVDNGASLPPPPPPAPTSAPATKQLDGVNDLLSQIRQGTSLRPVVQKEEKKVDNGWREVIDRIRTAWDQTSESSSSSSDEY